LRHVASIFLPFVAAEGRVHSPLDRALFAANRRDGGAWDYTVALRHIGG
jgi:hypothetical protein